MVTSRKAEQDAQPRRRPPTTPEGMENRIIGLAYQEAERLLLAGQASSQLITELVKRGSRREELERTKLEQESKLVEAKVDAVSSAKRVEELYGEAMNAFRGYQPSQDTDIV